MLDVGRILRTQTGKGVTMKTFVFAALRRACPTVFAALVAAASLAPVCAWAGDPSPASTGTKAAASAPATATTSGDKWRFVWHNNQWWYYQPSGQWLIHDGSAWHAPQAVAPTAQVYQSAPAYRGQSQPRYRQFMTNQRTYGGMDSDGMWGNSARYWTYQHVLKGK
jgi:hypothetical protein